MKGEWVHRWRSVSWVYGLYVIVWWLTWNQLSLNMSLASLLASRASVEKPCTIRCSRHSRGTSQNRPFTCTQAEGIHPLRGGCSSHRKPQEHGP